jgi:hypothetical protein
METPKRMIPYSVYLTEESFNKVKEAAKSRKAAGMVRDAIDLFIKGEKPYTAGYKKALTDVKSIVKKQDRITTIHVGGKSLSKILCDEIDKLKGDPDGKKKT